MLYVSQICNQPSRVLMLTECLVVLTEYVTVITAFVLTIYAHVIRFFTLLLFCLSNLFVQHRVSYVRRHCTIRLLAIGKEISKYIMPENVFLLQLQCYKCLSLYFID